MPESQPGLQESLAMARSRIRRQRLVHAFGIALRALGVVLFLAVIGAWIFPKATVALSLLAAFAVLAAVAALAFAGLQPVSDLRAARAIDTHFRLPDNALSASELTSEAGENWLQLQRKDTAARLTNLDWKTSWPVVWPKFSAAAGVAVLLLSVLLAVRLAVLPPSAPVAESGANENAAALEEMLADWEKAAELTDDPELKELVAELQPLRDELPKMNEREMLLALSKLETKLEALRDAASKDSLEASAGDMAAALENVEGQGALAAALRRKEFERAAELAAKEGEKLSQKGAKVPAGADSASTQQQMARASEKLSQSGQEKAASAMNQAREGAKNQNASQMGQGMKQLSQCLSKAGQCQSAQARLGMQLAQLGQCKNGMGKCDGEGRGMSLTVRLSEQKGRGKGAGSEIDLDREKDPTDLGSQRSLEGLTGMAGAGESETETLASDSPGSEAPREGRNAQFAKYEKLSQQAVADENLPPAYREAIRKYFEAIRPATEPVGP
jgi:hypothetical protein